MNTAEPAREAILDAALTRLVPFDSELANGLTNHAPMVVEALVALDRADAVAPWLDAYLPGARPARPPQPAIDPTAWQGFLGDGGREAAWRACFEQALDRNGWRDVLTQWLPRLAPGFAAAAAHGPIRTAHAARSLARLNNPLRVRELAGALALWASSHQTLPGDPLSGRGTRPPAEALAGVPLVSTSRRRNAGSITAALSVLAEEKEFPAAVLALDGEAHWDGLSLAVAETFAGLFVEQVHSPLEAIVFTHAVTGIAAARRLGAFVDEAVARSLVLHAWQTGCALYAAYGRSGRQAVPLNIPTPGSLVDAAVAHGDEHVIKLAEVCVEFHALTGGDRFLAAAERCRAAIPAAG